MKPEKIDDKFVSYATGQLESASPLSKWRIDACDKVKEYNAIPEEKRPNHSAVLKGTDNDDNYLLDCFADEYGNGDEVWIEIIPEDADDYKEMSYDDFDSNEKLKIIVAAYHHEEMEIVDIETYSLTDWLKSNNSKLLQALIKNKLIHEDTSKDHNCKPILSRDRNIYFCDECANQFELDAYSTNQDCCPICGASYDHLVLVGTRNGVRA